MAATKPTLHEQVGLARKRRDADIMRRHKKGETQEKIAAALGMTRNRVGQVIKANAPKGE